MAVDQTLVDTLAEEDPATLASMRVATMSAQASLQITKAQKSLQLVDLEISLAPLKLKESLLSSVVDAQDAVLDVFPSELLLKAPPLSDVVMSAKKSLSAPTEVLRATLFDIERLTAQLKSVKAEIAILDAQATAMDDTIAAIDAAIELSLLAAAENAAPVV
jgi:hypothetical protein